tara:strand:+ start:2755 stop:3540 length:786 start_codon:yes stop_codon:yes gene_type:complete
LNPKGILLFDIDGVIRDVTQSYRLALQETVHHYCNWRPPIETIDELKSEGIWNNDWNASQEIIRRYINKKNLSLYKPKIQELVKVFSDFYFGGNPNGGSEKWKGFIKNEPLLINKDFFSQLTGHKILWGFVSGAEKPSARFVLEKRLSLNNPPLIAMGEAPEKPNPQGLLRLASNLLGKSLGAENPPIGYVGDTVADVLTIKRAKENFPSQRFFSFAVAPPHLHDKAQKSARKTYEKNLKKAGADVIIRSTVDVLNYVKEW